jgi:hypothetical protein
VAIEHDGPFPVVGCRRPDVEEKAILGLRRLVAALARLERWSAEREGVADPIPRLQRGRGFKPVGTRDWAAVGDSFEGGQIASAGAAKAPGGSFHFDVLWIRGLGERPSAKGGSRKN